MRQDPNDRCKTTRRQDGRRRRSVRDDPSVIQQNEAVAKPSARLRSMNGNHGPSPVNGQCLVQTHL